MKKGLMFLVAFLFILNSDLLDARTRYRGRVSERQLLRDMRSTNVNIAVPAIRRATSKYRGLKKRRNIRRAKGILVRILKRRTLNPRIRIAAAYGIARMKPNLKSWEVRKAIRKLKRLAKRERNRSVKRAFLSNARRLESSSRSYRGSPRYRRSPSRRGSPRYRRSPSRRGSPRYKRSPRYRGSPSYRGSPRYRGR
ncbi:hypothetical protein ACFL20_04380 [Spirochaetota bacterium]